MRSQRLLWTTIFAVYCLSAPILAEEQPKNGPSAEDALQDDEMDMSKRDWKTLKMWGKRGWKRSIPSWADQLGYPPLDKRAWQNLQGGWGKRFANPNDDDLAMQQLADILEQRERFMQDEGQFNEEKRSWGKFNGGWGKRDADKNGWVKFHDSWGKRDPTWSNLKGVWGKRSYDQA